MSATKGIAGSAGVAIQQFDQPAAKGNSTSSGPQMVRGNVGAWEQGGAFGAVGGAGIFGRIGRLFGAGADAAVTKAEKAMTPELLQAAINEFKEQTTVLNNMEVDALARVKEKEGDAERATGAYQQYGKDTKLYADQGNTAKVEARKPTLGKLKAAADKANTDLATARTTHKGIQEKIEGLRLEFETRIASSQELLADLKDADMKEQIAGSLTSLEAFGIKYNLDDATKAAQSKIAHADAALDVATKHSDVDDKRDIANMRANAAGDEALAEFGIGPAK